MKKVIKSKSSLFGGREVSITIDEKLTALQGKILAPRMLAEANRRLKKIKSLPK